MGTRSNIGMIKENGEIEYVYSHWDGYPSCNGKILLEHYTDPTKIKKLIKLGSISSLGEKVTKPKGHSFERPIKGYTTFYGRDRGESDVESQTVQNLNDIEHEEFTYLFDVKNGVWKFSEGDSNFKLLTLKHCKD